MNTKLKQVDLGGAMLQSGRQAPATLTVMPMVLTLDQLRPNPDNPRIGRNPRYDEIKASICARGLDTVPKVTRNPEGEANIYIFSDGGNTRYEILRELWAETGEERFYRIHTLFKPWPGRLKCIIGHLAENEMRGELTFIAKALGIHQARTIYEDELQKSVSLRELSGLLAEQGLPIDNSSISRMENTLKYLYPSMPVLLESGLGTPQIRPLLALRNDAVHVWHKYESTVTTLKTFDEVFGECCQRFDSPDIWSLEMFRDELIGDLINALPHPSLDYDRWLLELDPKERNRRQLFGEPEPIGLPDISQDKIPESSSNLIPVSSPVAIQLPSQNGHAEPDHNDELQIPSEENIPNGDTKLPVVTVNRTEIQPDLYGAPPVVSGGDMAGSCSTPLISGSDETSPIGQIPIVTNTPDVSVSGLEPVVNIWSFSPLQDDIEHLQGMAFRLAFELSEAMGCEDEIAPTSESFSAGYRLVDEQQPSLFTALLLSLIETSPSGKLQNSLLELLTGGVLQNEDPMLSDEQAIRFLRLIRIVRRLRELQRQIQQQHSEECHYGEYQ